MLASLRRFVIRFFGSEEVEMRIIAPSATGQVERQRPLAPVEHAAPSAPAAERAAPTQEPGHVPERRVVARA